ncbi:ROK family protein [Enterococcus casseliflavus]|uniref:ROK family protein n=1 Tax=Enterococcus casseliflavus TaxID=37734 RepID=UPI00115CEC92|nr:ROK family protein [Enterococcus casseliflavus]
MKKMIGIDIGGTTIKLALINAMGNIQKKWQIPTNVADSGQYIPQEIVKTIEATLFEQTDQSLDIIGIGIGVPGPISPNGEFVVQAVNLGWSEMPLKSMIEKKLDIPVLLLNDANAAALGEMWQGAASGKQDLLFVTLGTGVGGGIIIDCKVVNGAHSSGGEIGHIPVTSDEKRICGCGNLNCLETFSSANGLVKTMTKLLESANETRNNFTTVDIFTWLSEGDDLATKAVDITVSYLGQVIAGIMNTIDAEEVVIGGGLSEAGDALLVPLKTKIDQHIFPQIKNNYKLSKAELGNNAGIYGAVYSVLSAQN